MQPSSGNLCLKWEIIYSYGSLRFPHYNCKKKNTVAIGRDNNTTIISMIGVSVSAPHNHTYIFKHKNQIWKKDTSYTWHTKSCRNKQVLTILTWISHTFVQFVCMVHKYYYWCHLFCSGIEYMCRDRPPPLVNYCPPAHQLSCIVSFFQIWLLCFSWWRLEKQLKRWII